MNREGRPSSAQRLVWVLALASIPALLAFVSLTAAGAQEPTGESTPAATIAAGEATPTGAGPTATPDQRIETVVRIEVDPGPFKSGVEFPVRVMVENVEHLASFQFAISYEPKRLQPVKPGQAEQTPGATAPPASGGKPVKAEGLGDIFTSSPRSDVVTCGQVEERESTLTAVCVTRSPPVCLGGPVGAFGSGLLGTVFFKSKGGGATTLTLTTSQLVLDDYQDCTVEVQGTTGVLSDDCLPVRASPDESADQLSCQPDGTTGRVVEVSGDIQEKTWVRLEDLGWASTEFLQPTGQGVAIPNRQQNAEVQLTGGGSSNTVLYIGIVVALVVIVGGGAGAYVLYRRRRPGPSV